MHGPACTADGAAGRVVGTWMVVKATVRRRRSRWHCADESSAKAARNGVDGGIECTGPHRSACRWPPSTGPIGRMVGDCPVGRRRSPSTGDRCETVYRRAGEVGAGPPNSADVGSRRGPRRGAGDGWCCRVCRAEWGTVIGQVLALVVWFVFGAGLLVDALDLVDWRIAVYAVLSLTVIRMVPVAISMIGAGFSRPVTLFIGWFGPRGLASVVFGLLIVEELPIDDPRVQTVLSAIVATVVLSVVAHGVSRTGPRRVARVRCRPPRRRTRPRRRRIADTPRRRPSSDLGPAATDRSAPGSTSGSPCSSAGSVPEACLGGFGLRIVEDQIHISGSDREVRHGATRPEDRAEAGAGARHGGHRPAERSPPARVVCPHPERVRPSRDQTVDRERAPLGRQVGGRGRLTHRRAHHSVAVDGRAAVRLRPLPGDRRRAGTCGGHDRLRAERAMAGVWHAGRNGFGTDESVARRRSNPHADEEPG